MLLSLAVTEQEWGLTNQLQIEGEREKDRSDYQISPLSYAGLSVHYVKHARSVSYML